MAAGLQLTEDILRSVGMNAGQKIERVLGKAQTVEDALKLGKKDISPAQKKKLKSLLNEDQPQKIATPLKGKNLADNINESLGIRDGASDRLTTAERWANKEDARNTFSNTAQDWAEIAKNAATPEEKALAEHNRETVLQQELGNKKASSEATQEAVSGGTFNSYQAQYLKNNEGSKSKIWHANNVGQKAKNYFTELEVLEKNGADESAKVALARKYGFEPTAGGNFTEMGNAHFRKQLDADPNLWEKAMAHNIPQKATALGLTGGAVLAMANSRGQKSNAELYGV